MSRYANDDRVIWPRPGSRPDVKALIPGPLGADDGGLVDGWFTVTYGGSFFVRDVLEVDSTTNVWRDVVFATLDDAIGTVLNSITA